MPSKPLASLVLTLLVAPFCALLLTAVTCCPRTTPVPEGFAAAMGYEPSALPGRALVLVSPHGDCSAPTGPTVYDFEEACQEHDLAYDVLRFRAARGEHLDPRERLQADARFALRMAQRCRELVLAEAPGCLATAAGYAMGVTVNSVRQGYGEPVAESFGEVLASSVPLAAAAVVPFAPAATGWRRRGGGQAASVAARSLA